MARRITSCASVAPPSIEGWQAARGGARGALGALMLAVALLVGGGGAVAQTSERLLQQAIQDYHRGDEAEALSVFQRLADRDNSAEALFWLGTMAYHGRGLPRNDAVAREYYDRAARGGSADAQNNLALMYRNGEGGAEDLPAAYAWFSLAAAQGSNVAANNLRRLEDRLTPRQKEQGRKTALTLTRAMTQQAAARQESARQENARAESARPESTRTVEAAVSPVPATLVAEPRPNLQALERRPATAPPAPAPAPDPAPGPVSETGPLSSVQVGLFGNRGNVERTRARLAAAGFDVHVAPREVGARTLHQVRIGPFASRAEAVAAAERVNALLGVTSTVLSGAP